MDSSLVAMIELCSKFTATTNPATCPLCLNHSTPGLQYITDFKTEDLQWDTTHVELFDGSISRNHRRWWWCHPQWQYRDRKLGTVKGRRSEVWCFENELCSSSSWFPSIATRVFFLFFFPSTSVKPSDQQLWDLCICWELVVLLLHFSDIQAVVLTTSSGTRLHAVVPLRAWCFSLVEILGWSWRSHQVQLMQVIMQLYWSIFIHYIYNYDYDYNQLYRYYPTSVLY